MASNKSQPHMRSKPELSELVEKLEDIIEWQILMLKLGLSKTGIDIIEHDKRGSISLQKQSAFNQWLRQTHDASWKDVIKALFEMKENDLATKLTRMYEWTDPRIRITKNFLCTHQRQSRVKAISSRDDQWVKFLPQPQPGYNYYTLDLFRQRAPLHINRRSLHSTASFFAKLVEETKPVNLLDFLKKIQNSEYKDDFKVGIEARFGKVYWQFNRDTGAMPPRQRYNWQRTLRTSRSSFFPTVDTSDVEALFRGRPLEKDSEALEGFPNVNFVILEGQDEGDYRVVVEEHRGTFTLDAVYREQKAKNKARFNFALPGRKYDFRIGDSTAALIEEHESGTPYQIAREIVQSIHRRPDNKLSLMVRGQKPVRTCENKWKMKYIRQRTQRQYEWKPEKKWVLVRYDVQEFIDIPANQDMIARAPLNEAVDIEFNYSRKEVELWGLKVFPRSVNKTRPSRDKYTYMESAGGVNLPGELPRKPFDWTAEHLMEDFEEFLEDVFEIAYLLDGSSPIQ